MYANLHQFPAFNDTIVELIFLRSVPSHDSWALIIHSYPLPASRTSGTLTQRLSYQGGRKFLSRLSNSHVMLSVFQTRNSRPCVQREIWRCMIHALTQTMKSHLDEVSHCFIRVCLYPMCEKISVESKIIIGNIRGMHHWNEFWRCGVTVNQTRSLKSRGLGCNLRGYTCRRYTHRMTTYQRLGSWSFFDGSQCVAHTYGQ
jgi:hypothetical protein